jgi:micrococcal nuclease
MYNYTAKVVRVVDGDTIDVEIDLGFDIWHKTRLRLANIDAFERYTDQGKKATEYVIEALSSQPTYEITTYKTDKYGRYLAEIFIKGNSLNKSLVDIGLAVPYVEGKR